MLEHPLNDDNILQLEQGILLHGETQHTLPAHITLTSPSSCNIAIQEGRYHQIKRMFAAVGNHVTQLHRFRIADIVLTSELPAGSFRPLNKDEINQFS